ncbi:MAG: histidine phosphatase family protein [Hyphomonadaceae bacterium]
MPRLILMRHAKAERPTDAPDDLSRRLVERGRRAAAEAAERMAAFGLSPTAALVSPSARTRETWESAKRAFDNPPIPEIVDALYESSVQTIWEAWRAAAADKPESITLIIGHNPGMQDLIARLLRQAHDGSEAARRMQEHLPTSGFAAFTIGGETLHAAGPALIGWGRLQGD